MGMLKEQGAEALVGLLVIAAAVWFVLFAFERAGGGGGTYAIGARFPNASGVSVGTDVRVAGLRVGAVAGSALDPETYQALLTLAIEDRVKLPVDTSAAITSEGILGSTYISLMPGGETEMLQAGDEIIDTQGSTDLMGLIGSIINRTGGGGAGNPEAAGAASGPSSTPSPPPSPEPEAARAP